jgi:hypothetical protein
MNAQLSLKAAEGRKVRDPRTGELVPHDRYVRKPKISHWLRRLKDGDVIEKPKAAPAKPKKTPKPKSKPGDKK